MDSDGTRLRLAFACLLVSALLFAGAVAAVIFIPRPAPEPAEPSPTPSAAPTPPPVSREARFRFERGQARRVRFGWHVTELYEMPGRTDRRRVGVRFVLDERVQRASAHKVVLQSVVREFAVDSDLVEVGQHRFIDADLAKGSELVFHLAAGDGEPTFVHGFDAMCERLAASSGIAPIRNTVEKALSGLADDRVRGWLDLLVRVLPGEAPGTPSWTLEHRFDHPDQFQLACTQRFARAPDGSYQRELREWRLLGNRPGARFEDPLLRGQVLFRDGRLARSALEFSITEHTASQSARVIYRFHYGEEPFPEDWNQ